MAVAVTEVEAAVVAEVLSAAGGAEDMAGAADLVVPRGPCFASTRQQDRA